MSFSHADAAQLKAVFGGTRGAYTLTPEVAEAATDFFSKKQRRAATLPLDPKAYDNEAFREEWAQYAEDAGLTLKSDIGNLVRWACADDGASGGGTQRALTRASAVVDLFKKRGIALPDGLSAEIEAKLQAVGEAGDELAQSTSSLAIVIMYLVDLPGGGSAEGVEGMVTWHENRAKALPADGTIDLRMFPPYWKLLKGTSRITLERALLDKDPSNRKLIYAKKLITQHLFTAGLPLAATRFQAVTGWAADHFRYAPAKEKEYLWGYFFISFLGRGLVEVRDRDTLIDMEAPSANGVGMSNVTADMRATVPADDSTESAALMRALMIGGGGGTPHTLLNAPKEVGEGASLPPSLGDVLQQALRQFAGGMGDAGGSAGGPAIRELPPPPSVKCVFCSKEHDPREKCGAMTQALRLKNDWDRKEKADRKAAEAAAKAAAAANGGATP